MSLPQRGLCAAVAKVDDGPDVIGRGARRELLVADIVAKDPEDGLPQVQQCCRAR
jgi:hypothetical protein